jgi:hypothetical protein
MIMAQEYDFPVYGTQGGGLVRRSGDHYVFVEKPNCPGLEVGDKMPDEWGLAPANQAAREEMSETDDDDHFLVGGDVDPSEDDGWPDDDIGPLDFGDYDDGGGAARFPDAGSQWTRSSEN